MFRFETSKTVGIKIVHNPIMIDAGGWIGLALPLIAFTLVSRRWLAGDSTIYQLANVAGSILLIINSFFYDAYPSVGINIAWVAIGLSALLWKQYCSRKIVSDIAPRQLSALYIDEQDASS